MLSGLAKVVGQIRSNPEFNAVIPFPAFRTLAVFAQDGEFDKMFQCSWATALCRFNWKLRQIHAEQSMKMSPTKLAENAAVTNARFASLHGLPVAPSPSRRRPFHSANRAIVTSLHGAGPQTRRASVCGSAAGVALRLRSARRSSSPRAPLSPLADHRPKPVFTAGGWPNNRRDSVRC